MKRIIATLLALLVLLCAASALCSCLDRGDASVGVSAGTGEAPNDAVYSELLTSLRQELDRLKSENRAEVSEYEAEIKRLEKELAAVSAASTTASLQESSAPDEELPITYEEKNGEIIVTGCKNGISVLVIPDTINGKPVTSIADSAFAGMTLTGVSVPPGVRVIGWFAFSGCVGLKSVNLPESVEVIGYDAFANCKRLTVFCPAGSYAEKYTASYGINCVTS